ncbi:MULTISPECIES: acetate kinase [unclassified Pseudoxanthomonas]|uniref:acetate kinase n=1 Tax=unclassified Pseudoxanthomonas TaxID=2645906 RepID=UPI003078448B
MKRKSSVISQPAPWMLAIGIGLSISGQAWAQEDGSGAAPETRLDILQKQINLQNRKLDEMRQSLSQQEQDVARLQEALNEEILASARARGAPVPSTVPSLAQGTAAYAQAPQQPQPVGQAPESDSRPPEVAQIFDQPGVLTPPGKLVLEPSLQYGYSANDRVALVGYTVIPAILIGLIDVRQVKTTTAIATLTGRYGLNNRFEMEAKLPYVYIDSDTVSREIFTGSAQDNVFNASGRGLGDVELTARYQINRGGPDKPFYIGWLRYKSRTGKDPFDVVTDCVTRCVGNTTGTGLPLELPTGSGFASLQPGVTWLYPSDPVVFFGSFSYLHNFKRKDVSRTVIGGQEEFLGEVQAGDIVGFNLGMGLALNEKAAISLGYDQSIVGKTKQNGQEVAGAVRMTLGTLLLGGTYRFSEKTSLNVALGVGVTRDTPDMTITARVPITF